MRKAGVFVHIGLDEGLVVVHSGHGHHREKVLLFIRSVGLSKAVAPKTIELVHVIVQEGQEVGSALGDLSSVLMVQGPDHLRLHISQTVLVNADLGNTEKICCHF